MREPWYKSADSMTWAFTRKKIETGEPTNGKLKRVLTCFDLTALGTGSTLGCGVYVLAGAVAKSVAGPAVIFSFAIAAVVSAFSGLCYAEFASRIPKSGSAYIYTYVAIGEFTAFIIGWNLLIEHLIGTASVAKAMSNYCDSLLGNPQRMYMMEYFPIHVSFMADYPDVASFIVIIIMSTLVAWGARESSITNNIFTLLNFITVITVIATGFYKANFSNWSIPKSEIPPEAKGGEGGFLPFGWVGVVAGAAKCFYGFVGFDSIATTGEETKNPKRDIPMAIVVSLFLSTLAYCGIAVVQTLMWPYYSQDPDAPLPVLYESLGMTAVKTLVTIGAIFALCTSLLGALFPLPRILYAMASDGLLFKFLSRINTKTKTPVISTMICGIAAGTLAIVFKLGQLIDMASIGTLQAYTIVCICVLVLRYSDNTPLTIDSVSKSKGSTIRTWLNLSNVIVPNADTQYASRVLITIFSVFAFVFGISFVNMQLHHGTIKNILIIINFTSLCILLASLIVLCRLPKVQENLSFEVPFVPILPCMSIVLNIYLMLELDYKTWIRFILWISCGLVIYFTYGINHSLEAKKQNIRNDSIEIKLSN